MIATLTNNGVWWPGVIALVVLAIWLANRGDGNGPRPRY